MSYVGMVCIIFGSLIVISRGLIVAAPAMTLEWFRDLISSEARVGVIGICLLVLPAVLIWTGISEETVLAQVLLIFGLLLLLVFIPWPVFFPRSFTDILNTFLPSDLLTWRLLGLMGVFVGLVLIYLGWGAL